MDWLPEGELQADALRDLVTNNNELSLWFVSDDENNLSEVIAALSLSGDYISVVDYVLIDIDLLHRTGLEIAENPGETPFEGANHWHRDLVKLTAGKVVKLAELVGRSRQERCQDKAALAHIAQAVNFGKVNTSRISSDLRQSLIKRGIALEAGTQPPG